MQLKKVVGDLDHDPWRTGAQGKSAGPLLQYLPGGPGL